LQFALSRGGKNRKEKYSMRASSAGLEEMGGADSVSVDVGLGEADGYGGP